MDITLAALVVAFGVIANVCAIIGFIVDIVDRWKAKHIEK